MKLESGSTILYYSSSREKPEFEDKIISNLLDKAGDLPIISVTQKPCLLGFNICVGDMGLSYLNMYRQRLIGAREAKTRFLVFAESDVLAPFEYYRFEPPEDGVWRYDNVWMAFYQQKYPYFHRKKWSEGVGTIVSRDLLISRYEPYLAEWPEWLDGRDHNHKLRFDPLYDIPHKYFSGPPLLSMKTGNGVRHVTDTTNKRSKVLEGWGTIESIKQEYLWI